MGAILLIHEEKNPPEWRVYRVKKDQIGALARYVAISSAGSLPPVAHTGWVALSNQPEQSDDTSIRQRLDQDPGTDVLPPLLLPFASKGESDGLPYAFADYLMLVSWTGRAIRADKRGHIPTRLIPILMQLGLDGPY